MAEQTGKQTEETNFDVVFIGAGPGGYVGAIRAAQLGLKTAVVEKEKTLGGTCLNVGCIPSKALLDSSEHFAMAQKDLSEHGVVLEQVALDLKKMMGRKDKIVADLTGGIDYLFKKNKVTRFFGNGHLKGPSEVEVETSEKKKISLKAKNIVLATGSVPNELPQLPFDGKTVISSTEALALSQVPKHLIVVGGGYIGLEMGSVWLRLGAKVTVIEYAEHICGGMDRQTSKKLQQILKKQGMEFVLGAEVLGVEFKAQGSRQGDTKEAQVLFKNRADGKQASLAGDVVLVAAGRRPFFEGLGLENVKIQQDAKGFVKVNEHYETSQPHVYAIGDLIPGPMLAHKAEEEGVAVAEILAGLPGHVNYDTLPGVIYTWPEVASVGKTEEQLKEEGTPYKVGSFPFSPNGRARAMGFTEGQAKILAHKDSDRVLGVHIVGPRASDMLAEAVMAMEFAASSEDIARSFHAHPTLSEVLREAALAVDGRARQF